ncbi:hypothetical protein [Hymenobacter armeniacus]|uniref:Uncharacterized protein n=1 Tax=Hymenobacter armeniacus TaxID=2771358 RepID=A0ABR8JU19_9BACT|nr:hypothetical protein [Hymenobacter armeniacus]MBD2723353.1 hypothetical protein [Hymenobacter armeniacus]
MSAALRYYVGFKTSGSIPRIEKLLLDTIDITGLSIVATSNVNEDGKRVLVWIIKAKSRGGIFKDSMEVRIFEYDGEYIIVSNPASRGAPYLVVSLLFVFQQLGGVLNDILPDWAGKSWDVVRPSWNSSKVHTPE